MIKRLDYVGADFDENKPLWKYFSLKNFLWLIQNKSLYFGRVDEFEDRREFLVTDLHAKCFRCSYKELYDYVEKDKSHTFINCWTMAKDESYLMWKAYSNLYDGIVIKTTARRLMNSYQGNQNVYIGKVSYINEEKQSAQPFGKPLNWLYLIFAKLWFYEEEKELRLFFAEAVRKTSRILPVNLETLIEEIRLAPKSEPALADVIHYVLKDANLNIAVRKSMIEI